MIITGFSIHSLGRNPGQLGCFLFRGATASRLPRTSTKGASEGKQKEESIAFGRFSHSDRYGSHTAFLGGAIT